MLNPATVKLIALICNHSGSVPGPLTTIALDKLLHLCVELDCPVIDSAFSNESMLDRTLLSAIEVGWAYPGVWITMLEKEENLTLSWAQSFRERMPEWTTVYEGNNIALPPESFCRELLPRKNEPLYLKLYAIGEDGRSIGEAWEVCLFRAVIHFRYLAEEDDWDGPYGQKNADMIITEWFHFSLHSNMKYKIYNLFMIPRPSIDETWDSRLLPHKSLVFQSELSAFVVELKEVGNRSAGKIEQLNTLYEQQ